ncbi:MAG: hypothetical protein IJX12_07860 [Lachnospiraceae bacterium]|nr:hypothetical protein [Lachnospiraceae bacterium]
MDYCFITSGYEYMKLAHYEVYPITYRDGAWIYEDNGKFRLAYNTIKN